MKICTFVFAFLLVSSTFGDNRSKLNIDSFFNATFYTRTSLSPNGKFVLVNSLRPSWENEKFSSQLWLHETDFQNKKYLIDADISRSIRPQWSPSGNWFIYLLGQDKSKNQTNRLQLFNVKLKNILTINIGEETPIGLTWSNRETSLYLTTLAKKSTEEDPLWKGTIRYRESISNDRTNIHRIDIQEKRDKMSFELTKIKTVDFIVSNLVYASAERKLVLSSIPAIIEDIATVELFALDLNNISSLTRLTFNGGIELSMQVSYDGRRVFYDVFPVVEKNEQYRIPQARLYSIDISTGNVERWAADFTGSIAGYALRVEGGIYILGIKGTNVGIYTQKSTSSPTVLESKWPGTFGGLSVSSSDGRSSLAFTYSSSENPEEVYFARNVGQLSTPTCLTNSNQYLNEFDLPKSTPYQWRNKDDRRQIEGMLHYPPGQWKAKNLPLLILIHGGPASTSLNMFQANWYSWAPLAASQGWLVLEPNYRGSLGYGDDFSDGVRAELLTRPGNDILDGVDQLIADGIADPKRLNIGGYSYGGYLTNWLITQTTRFNSAVSGAGAVEHISSWGTMDIPTVISQIIGGNPWEIPQRYVNESALFQLDKVLTPTHIVTGGEDIRVPISQSLILERGLHALGIPSQLLLFPGEGHDIQKNPWYGKIKVREELKWLEKYGHQRFVRNKK